MSNTASSLNLGTQSSTAWSRAFHQRPSVSGHSPSPRVSFQKHPRWSHQRLLISSFRAPDNSLLPRHGFLPSQVASPGPRRNCQVASPAPRRNSVLVISAAGTETAQLDGGLDTLFAGIQVLDTRGSPVPAVSLWSGRVAVIGWARHFGCLLCKKRAAQLGAQMETLEKAGAALVLIGPGTHEQAAAFAERNNFPGEVYADPSQASFKALGFVSGIETVINIAAAGRLLGAVGEGFRQDWDLSLQKETVTTGSWQQGGVLVAGPGPSQLRYLFKDKQAGDEPDMPDVLKACCGQS